MDRLLGTLSRLRALWRHETVEHELDEELRFHVEMETRAGIERGLPPEEARRRALVSFGGVERHKEDARDTRGLNWLHEAGADLRLGARLLASQPVFTAAAVLTLALGIGANTAIFSVVDAVLLRNSPFADPDRLVMLWETDRGSGTNHEPASWPDVVDFRERSRTLADIGSVAGRDVTVSGQGDPMRVTALMVTPNLPRLLGVRPVLGRLFSDDEGDANGLTTAILGEAFWRSRFQADSSIVGRTIIVDEQPLNVVGVAPADADLGVRQVFDRADYAAAFSGAHADIWLAVRPTADAFPRSTHPFLTLGRLAPGASLSVAQRELASISADLERAYQVNANRGVNLERYSDVVFAPVRTALLMLLGAVMLVLLVTCANVANLLLARTTTRVREVAVRVALGAGAGRIRRQFLAESVLLVLLGSAAAVAVAYGGLRALVALAPADIPRLESATVNAGVLGYTAAVAVVVAIVFGMLPALQLRRLEIQQTLRSHAGRGNSEGRGARRFRSALVIAEVATAVMLVVGAGLLLRSLWQLQTVNPGFDATRVLKAQYQLPETRYPMNYRIFPDLPEINGFHARFLAAVRAIPGVESAALAGGTPLDAGFTNSFSIIGREAESSKFPEIRTRFMSPGYLATLSVPLLSGRDVSDADDAHAPMVVLINRAAADRYFPDGNAVGQELRFWGVARRIAGVMGDEKFRGIAAPTDPAAYAPLAQAPRDVVTLLVRSAGSDPTALVPAIRKAFQALDPQLALFGVEPLGATLSESIAKQRFNAMLLAIFAGVAILLALVGVYGVLNYTVARRAPEIGIRMALGANRWSVLGGVVREGMGIVGVGVAIGVAAALAGSRVMASLVFGVTATDPATYAGVAVAVLATAALASLLPALRATRVDPIDVLRAD